MNTEKEEIYKGSLKKLAVNCKRLRIEKNWSIYQLNFHSEVAVQTLYDIEAERNNITLKTIESVAFALGVTSTELLGKTQ